MTYRVRNIGIAVALALVAALLTTFYVSNYRRHVQHEQSPTPVLVAVKDIPAGTPGSVVVSGHYVAVRNVVQKNRVPGVFTAPTQLQQLVATQAIYAGEQVNARRFGTVKQTGIRSLLTGTLRGYEIDGDQNQLLAGVLKPGDHVDLVAALKVRDNPTVIMSRVVMRNLKVLQPPASPAVGSKLTGTSGQDYSAIFAMTDSQSQKFQYVLAKCSSDSSGTGGGCWHVALRPPLKDDDSPDHLDSLQSVMGDGLAAPQRSKLGG